MEKPRIVEAITDHCAETRRRIAAYLMEKMQAFDDNLYHLGDAFPEDDEERLATAEELEEIEEAEHRIFRGEK